MSHGLLWNYHLHYLNWLSRSEPGKNTLFSLYVAEGHGAAASLAPYPTALRIVNVVKAIASRAVDNSQAVRNMVCEDTHSLARNLEYHLLGNHLLEDGFGLLWGGFYLHSDRWWRKGKEVVLSQLREQILQDGGHFERSPMYHSLLLWRILDTINLLLGSGKMDTTVRSLVKYGRKMVGWLRSYPFDGTGYLNDSAQAMVPTKEALLDYARRLGIDFSRTELRSSGFRVLSGLERKGNTFRVLADVGSVGPSYIPGHAHAGTLSFELCVDDVPILIDTGTSTYEANERRVYERSTHAHNTVSIGRLNSSEVWGVFRVARRARVVIEHDEPNHLVAMHDGYKSRLGLVHRRDWQLHSGLTINDRLIGRSARQYGGTAHFIFHPEAIVLIEDTQTVIANSLQIRFDGARRIEKRDVEIADGFNRLLPTIAIYVHFKNELTTTIAHRT